MTNTKTPLKSTLLLAVLAALGFSAKAIFVKIAYRLAPIDAATILALRMLFSAPFFLLMSWQSSRKAGAIKLTSRDIAIVIALGFMGYFVSSYLDFLGLRYISAGLERLILYLYPTFVALLSWLFLRKPIQRRQVAALLLGYMGIGLVYVADLQIATDGRALLLGAVLVATSSMTYAVYLVGAGTIVTRIGSTRFTALAMLSSSVFAVAYFFFNHGWQGLVQPWSIYQLMVLMAILATVLPIWFVAIAISRIGATSVSIAGMAGPIGTLFMGAWLLDEPFTWVQVLGCTLVVSGVLMLTLKKNATVTLANPPQAN